MRFSIKKRKIQISLILGLVLAATAAHADFGTHLNVTVVESIFQETSFAENYTETEWQKICYSEGTINISNQNTETLYDIYLSFTNTNNMQSNFTHDATTKWGNQTSGAPGSTMVLYVPELRQGNYSVFTYNISCKGQNPMVNIQTDYSNSDHGYDKKVLAGYNWTINQTVSNENPSGNNITNVNITIIAQNVTWNDSSFPFSLEFLQGVGDYSNVAGNGTSTQRWWWAPNGGELEDNDNKSIRYIVRAPYSVPMTATYMALREIIEYQVDYLLSNLTLVNINASAQVDLDFEKRISQPADDPESNNVTWRVDPLVTTPVNVTYDLNQVTLWVTENQDPTNDTASTPWGKLEINYTGSPLQEINLTTGWGSGVYWEFNYTDSTLPPIVWLKPDYLISHKYAQIVNYTKSVNGNDVYLKYIYVIHGYWLEVQKNVTSIGEDQYQIDILVENIGNGWTPNGTYVTVFDFVPNEFAWGNMDPSPYDCPGGSMCSNLSVGNPGDDYEGMSFRWNIGWKGTMNASLGPKTGPDATTVGNYSWNVSYIVNGSGEYKVTELYIVGLDPLKVDGAFSSPIITIISGIQSHTNEIIYVSVLAFLIIINITNLVMTNRIHRKLQDSLPAAPPPRIPEHNWQHPPQ